MKIKGFDKRYSCDENGFIYSENYKNSGKTVKMRPALDSKGYLRTMLLDENGKYRTIKVHRIIASAFIDNKNCLPQVNHKNGIKTDNRAENLEWCTNKENVIHSYANKLQIPKRGENHHRSLLKKIDKQSLIDSYKELKAFNLVAKKYNLDRHAVSRVLKVLLNEINQKTNGGL